MIDTDFYQQVLGLTPPWHVSRVELLIDSEEVLIHVTHSSSGQAQCPMCRKPCPGYDTMAERRWRHLDTCQLKTYLVCDPPRVQCAEHGIHVAYMPWSEPNSRFTSMFECLAISVLRATVVQDKAARLLRLSPSQVHDIMHRAVGRGLERRNDDQVMEDLGIDEKSIHSGHSYMTILSDTNGKRVVEVTEGRTLVAAKAVIAKGVSPKQRLLVKAVSMDMWENFQRAVASELPAADIVHDRFHIAKYLADAVDQTRRAGHKRLLAANDKTLNKSKYVFLKNPEKMTVKQKEMFTTLMASDLETSKVWALKDTFKDFFACTSVEQGEAFFANWYQAAIDKGNRYMTKVADMLQSHIGGLLNYLKHKVNNATAEGLNSQIQHIKASAKGYRKFESFRVAILFHLGKLDLYPQKSL